MKATDILKHEHEIVLMVLDAVEREAQKIRTTGNVDRERIAQIVNFFHTFVDNCHLRKEEQELFPRLETCGIPCCGGGGGPVAVMLYEHTLGRSAVAAMAAALKNYAGGDTAAAETLAENLTLYVNLLRDHIEKENNVLFEMANQFLSPQAQQSLIAAFDVIEADEILRGMQERWHQFAHPLEARTLRA